jgi:heme exporter protein A
MNDYSLKIDSVSKVFGRRLIFKDISIEYNHCGIFGIAGPNGSGKSTLMKIIAGLLSSSHGKVYHSANSKKISPEKLHNYIGFVSPYLILYDEFSAEENIYFLSKIRGIDFNKNKSDFLFNELNLCDRKNDLLKTYSSGMKQRMKFILALIHTPQLLILDEPSSNLDDKGKEKINELIKEKSKSNIILIASNEEHDLSLCSSILELNKYKGN